MRNGLPGSVELKLMNFSRYQRLAYETRVYPNDALVVYPALGIAGEAGEIADLAKKLLRGDFGEDWHASINNHLFSNAMRREIGDELWYLANLSSDLEFDFQDLAVENLKKLYDRKARGVLQGSGDER